MIKQKNNDAHDLSNFVYGHLQDTVMDTNTDKALSYRSSSTETLARNFHILENFLNAFKAEEYGR